MADASDEAPEPTPDLSELHRAKVVDHPDEFVRELTGITVPWQQAFGAIRPWFRGLSKLSHSLEPTLLRYRAAGLSLPEVSLNLIHQFRGMGAPFHVPADLLDRITVMQHHGMPTCLLDWTENALAGLFFAVRNVALPDDQDAVVWILEPLRLAEIQKYGRRIPFADSFLLGVGNLPLPFYPVHCSPRVTAQRGTFTLHPFTPQHSLARIALAEKAAGRLSPLQGIRIRGSQRRFIRGALADAFGLGEYTFFPDLDGLVREVRIREGLEGKG
jgi:hypothetical protein